MKLEQLQFLNRIVAATAKSFDGVVRVLSLVAAVFILVLMVFITTDVSGRYLFNRPIEGTWEISESLMVFIVFIAFAYALARGRHIRVELITSRVNPRAQVVLYIFACAGGAFLFALITWQGWNWAWASWQMREFMHGPLQVPFYPSKFAVPFGGFFFTLQFLVEIARAVSQLMRSDSRKC